jgi:hypothetical protein
MYQETSQPDPAFLETFLSYYRLAEDLSMLGNVIIRHFPEVLYHMRKPSPGGLCGVT